MSSSPDSMRTAWQHFAAGGLDAAEAICRPILDEQPDHPDALHLSGLIALRSGRTALALDCIARAIRSNPAVAAFYNSMGEVYRAAGQLQQASASYRAALQRDPSHAEALNNLGIVFRGLREPEQARAHFLRALALRPSMAEAHDNLGTVLQDEGRLDEALARHEKALALKPDLHSARLNIAGVLRAQGRKLDGVRVLLDGVIAQPRNFQMRCALAKMLEGFPLQSADDAVRSVLLDLCYDDNVSTQCLAAAVVGLVKCAPAFPRLLEAALAGADILSSNAAEAAILAGDPLLVAVLSRAVAGDPDLERVLTCLRRGLLLRFDSERGIAGADGGVGFAFACALARQCFNTEYAYFAADDELGRLPRLIAHVDSAISAASAPSPALERQLTLAALYAPLHRLPGWERLLRGSGGAWSDAFRPIWQEQIVHCRREQDIARHIEAITPIRNDVSLAVRGQYEQSPYPRWITLLRPPATTLADALPKRRFGGDAGAGPRTPSILIAGCGTGQHPLQTAMMFPACEVVAIDLSQASLAYAARMAERFSVRNLRFLQADILELGSWPRRFDLVESSGVLHHMKDPLEGWRVLAGLLRDGGTMKVGLYSRSARKRFQAARELARDRGFPATPEGIRACRKAILDLPPGDPARRVLVSDDFYSMSGCRDLLMHVQEHTYALPEIAGFLRELGLEFLGFQCPAEITAEFRAMFRDPAALLDLALWDRFESARPETFVVMYQFLCGRRLD